MFTFSTIRHENSCYHGIVLNRYESGFVFAFRVNDRNYVWDCCYEYWELIE